ncbi:MAG: signal recognition particle protein [Acidobacteriota bacterium]|nr:signal recognition particle protein [Blastocatellia bacterium]MDW8412667.1 signal recognition particle protein [Acidobacteriota bacterium]
MFDALSDKLKKVLRNLRGHDRLTAEHIEAAMREIRIALLEADVNYKVVKQFVENVKQKAIGQAVLESLSPEQQVVKIVYDELVEILGGSSSRLVFLPRNPNVVMIVGLQGSGKTTTTGKLAKFLTKHQNRHPLMVSADVYRPAAREQLSIIAKEIGQAVFEAPEVNDPLELCRQAFKYAQQTGYDTLLIDTAGRLHIDEQLMEELRNIKAEMQPIETLFVADAMTGQDAVKSATEFHNRIGISGVILTKMDGDARGGAALSVKIVTGQPIKFVGVGEKYDALEQFYPDRIAQRILGMGDVLTLIEKVQQEIDEEQAAAIQQKMLEDRFTLEDYRQQLKQMQKLGSVDKLMKLLPEGLMRSLMGFVPKLSPEQTALMEKKLRKTEAIINSMTIKERNNYHIIDASRRRRIARGSGTTVKDVNELLEEYIQMRRVMRQMLRGGLVGGFGGKLLSGIMSGRGGPGGIGKKKKKKK